MSSNPFEPPRTTDLDRGADAVEGGHALSDEAMMELVAAAPWVRWLARVTSASIAVGLGSAVADLVTIKQPTARIAILLATAVSTMVSTLFLVAWRRYAAASELLRSGARGAAGQVIDAQASLFKLIGVLLAIATGLFILVFVVGYTLGRLGAMR
jgi:hypothetical protein